MDQVNVVKVTKEKTIQGRQFKGGKWKYNTRQVRLGEFHALLFQRVVLKNELARITPYHPAAAVSFPCLSRQ